MGRKNRIRKVLRRGVPLIAAGALVAMMAACANIDDATSDLGAITAQASGKFSGGSLSIGSVQGFFTAVGLGNADRENFTIEMTVNGVVWFSCVNNGGNLAPGQFDYNGGVSVDITAMIDENGRYVTPEGEPIKVEASDPTNEDCKRPKNWTVVTYESSEEPITYLQPKWVYVDLVRSEDPENSVDSLVYDCGNLPDPTYPLEEYVGPTDLTGGGYCTLQ